METLSLLSILNSYGDIVELDYKFDSDTAISELKNLKTWHPSIHNKKALNLTGPIDDIGLLSPDKHEENQKHNQNLLSCPTLHEFFKKWENLARCRAVIMNSGSFFKLHRDAYGFNPQFRIFIPLNATETNQWCFVYNDELVKFKPGVPYLLNTRKPHGSFSMVNGVFHVLMSLYITESNVKRVSKLLPNTSDL